MNIVLIISLLSNFFAAPNEVPVSIADDQAGPPQSQEVITVEVLNACGANGVAKTVEEYLRLIKLNTQRNHLFVSGAGLQYKPYENFTMRFEFNQQQNSFLSPNYYNNYRSPLRHERSVFDNESTGNN